MREQKHINIDFIWRNFSIMKTFSAKESDVKRSWYAFDASQHVLGRLASEVAKRLRGKHKPEYTPHVDTGDYIIIYNAGLVKVTGNKRKDKTYYRHSGYPGGLKTKSLEKMLEDMPVDVLEIAIRGMLPKGPLGRDMFRKLKVYASKEHPHVAQAPIEVKEF